MRLVPNVASFTSSARLILEPELCPLDYMGVRPGGRRVLREPIDLLVPALGSQRSSKSSHPLSAMLCSKSLPTRRKSSRVISAKDSVEYAVFESTSVVLRF